MTVLAPRKSSSKKVLESFVGQHGTKVRKTKIVKKPVPDKSQTEDVRTILVAINDQIESLETRMDELKSSMFDELGAPERELELKPKQERELDARDSRRSKNSSRVVVLIEPQLEPELDEANFTQFGLHPRFGTMA